MKKISDKNLHTFKGWLLVFLLMHAPIALYNLTGGLTIIGNFIREGASLWFVILYGLLSFALPITLVLLLKRKPAFRWFYVLYAILMGSNFLLQQGITITSVAITLLCTLPWTLYLFLSQRVLAVVSYTKPQDE